MWKLLFLTGAGGFIGASLRFLINRMFILFWKLPFPLATFVINITGCFAFGIILGFLQRSGFVSPRLNSFLIVGICGGFTTFSTFSYEALSLGMNGQLLLSFLYLGISVILGLLATWFGLLISN